ncbi:MAG: CDP-diacylglycerol--glycerol-3-phosphate 3-phosphatidyltransferase [Lentisphaeria bacterium]|nr:CDP-diacylglycerol--glycerol-3-phosphate 3-phosphatidyltransferase [Lentisphaeria bacterium]
MKHLPNALTISRIVLIFCFVVLANFDNVNPTCIKVGEHAAYVCHVIALIVAFLAGITDLLDGYLARKYHVESDFGRLMDPLADKIFILATFVMMLDYGMIPGWVLIVILTREFMVTGLRTLASSKGVIISADRWGKMKTATQMFTLAFGGAAWIHLFGLDLGVSPVTVIWKCLQGAVVLITVGSGLQYFIRYRSLFSDSI